MIRLFRFMIHELLINIYIHSKVPVNTKLRSLALRNLAVSASYYSRRIEAEKIIFHMKYQIKYQLKKNYLMQFF